MVWHCDKVIARLIELVNVQLPYPLYDRVLLLLKNPGMFGCKANGVQSASGSVRIIHLLLALNLSSDALCDIFVCFTRVSY